MKGTYSLLIQFQKQFLRFQILRSQFQTSSLHFRHKTINDVFGSDGISPNSRQTIFQKTPTKVAELRQEEPFRALRESVTPARQASGKLQTNQKLIAFFGPPPPFKFVTVEKLSNTQLMLYASIQWSIWSCLASG